MNDDEGWEARMAARARERAQKREDAAAKRVQANLDSLPAWLNGNQQVSGDGTTVWIFPSNRCICCGTSKDICCFAYPPDYVAPPEPDWPFTYEHCPLCVKDQGLGGVTFYDTFDRIGTGTLGGDYDQTQMRFARWNSGGKR